MVHPARLPDDQLLRDCRQQATRRGGPGGQRRNKVETAVVLLHEPSGIAAEANQRRSRAENLRQALHRLRVNLALQVRTTPAAGQGDAPPSVLWTSRCRRGRLYINPEHRDFPALLAEALDRVAASGFDVRAAAAQLGCTASQLVKLLKLEPRAMQWVNDRRAEAGLHRLW